MTEELKQAVTLIRSGQKARGGQLLAKILRGDPQNELAWLWLSQTVKTKKQQQNCLEKVLAINPNNQAAQKALAKIKQTSPNPSKDTPSFAPPTDPFTFKSKDGFQAETQISAAISKPKVPPKKRPPMNAAERNKVFIIGGVLMVKLMIIVIAAVLLVQNQQYEQDFAPMIDVCRGKRVSAASRYSTKASIHPAIGVERGSSGWNLDNQFIPRQARTQSITETQLVLCMGRVEDIFIESCPYYNLDNPTGPIIGRIERYYYKQEGRLIEASTGRVVSKRTFTGKSARLCKQIEKLPRDGRTVVLKGTGIPKDDVYNWVESQLIE